MKTIGRILGGAWLAPISLLGVIVALLCGARGEVSRGAWFVHARGFVDTIMARLDIAGFTWGQVVILREAYFYSPTIREHELRHVLQGLFCGVLFPVVYTLVGVWAMVSEPFRGANTWRDFSFSAWYWYNAFEVDARRAEMPLRAASMSPNIPQGAA